MKRKCDNCGNDYEAKSADVRRGWGLCCSKSCAASKREKSKPGYSPGRVARNNIRRVLWNETFTDENLYGIFKGKRTSEGYKMYEHGNGRYTAIDEYDEPVYDGDDWYDDPGDSEYWDNKDF